MRDLLRSWGWWGCLGLLGVLVIVVWREGVPSDVAWTITGLCLLVAGLVAYRLGSIHRERARLEASLTAPGFTPPDPGGFDWLCSPVSRLRERLEALHARLASLREQRDRFRAVLDGFDDGLLVLDPDDRIRYVNRVGRSRLNLPEEPGDRTLAELTRSEEITAVVAEAREDDRVVERETTRVEPDRETILRLRAYRGDGNVVLVIRDVTRIRRLQTVREDFVANVSHELKTPLAAIRGRVETLRDDPEMDADTRRRFLDRVKTQVESMTELVEDLLTLSRLEGEEDVEEENLDVRGPVQDAIDAVRPRARRQSIDLEATVPDDPLRMTISRAAVRQLVGNLVDNAVKYTPEGGNVRVGVDGDKDAVRFEVEDTGVGIEPRDQERIFERFYRVDEARSRGGEGEASTGLGLAIVKHVAQSMGGRIELDSTPGQGSRFHVVLPRERSETSPT